jgi:hypothetical protein
LRTVPIRASTSLPRSDSPFIVPRPLPYCDCRSVDRPVELGRRAVAARGRQREAGAQDVELALGVVAEPCAPGEARRLVGELHAQLRIDRAEMRRERVRILVDVGRVDPLRATADHRQLAQLLLAFWMKAWASPLSACQRSLLACRGDRIRRVRHRGDIRRRRGLRHGVAGGAARQRGGGKRDEGNLALHRKIL